MVPHDSAPAGPPPRDDQPVSGSAGHRRLSRGQARALRGRVDGQSGDGNRTRTEVDEAIRLTARGIDAEIHDEQRYLRLAEMLIAHGRFGTARTVLMRLRRASADLDITPPPSYAELEALATPTTGGRTVSEASDRSGGSVSG